MQFVILLYIEIIYQSTLCPSGTLSPFGSVYSNCCILSSIAANCGLLAQLSNEGMAYGDIYIYICDIYIYIVHSCENA